MSTSPKINKTHRVRAARKTQLKHSILIQKYKNPPLISTLLPAKCTKKKSLPPRGKGGQFIKKIDPTTELSKFASDNSSLLDTPELSERALTDNEASASEHKVNKQLEECKDNEESLPGVPDPSLIIHIPEPIHSIPFPSTQHFHQLTAPTMSKPRPFLKKSTISSLIPAQVQYLLMATTPTPALFSGSSNENPQNFLQEVERYIHVSRITDEAMKVIIFSMFISAGSQADIWWDTLTAVETASWATVKAAFQVQWLPIVAAAKSAQDYQEELLALRLKEEDVGEHIIVAGVSTWSHLHYHACLQKLVQDAGVESAPVFIHQVCKALPNKIKNTSIDVVKDKAWREKKKKEVEKAQNLRIAKLNNRQTDSVQRSYICKCNEQP
ncbi:uncharacterized protein EDB93DRAFT_1244672 [Suillus bovinus]|uniref:uncharacterized protein n=1 Tax=Suillus bovinus TaxID=48563 RepID=UPI001B85F9D6|nr:uncharacterized protein EDB93DRAFT_1244672 [Suillus bovinus]KAG2159905.1 hypothetical protein EDB93DRAFT_1244672 [Suillus bovinus]